MIWDVLIVYFLLAFAAAGWAAGFSSAWPILPAAIGATVFTRWFYVDLATFFVQEMRCQPEVATFLAYAALWIGLEVAIELFIGRLTPVRWRRRPGRYDRAAGSMAGLVKGACVLTFACMAVVATTTVPSPAQISMPAAWILPTASESLCLRESVIVAKSSQPVMEKYIVSNAEPSFSPNYEKHPSLPPDKKRQVDAVVDAIKMWKGAASSDYFF